MSTEGNPQVANGTQKLGVGGGGVEEQRRRPFRGTCFSGGSERNRQWEFSVNAAKEGTGNGDEHPGRPESGGTGETGTSNLVGYTEEPVSSALEDIDIGTACRMRWIIKKNNGRSGRKYKVREPCWELNR